MIIRIIKDLRVDVYRDIEFMNNNSNHADIIEIKKINNEFIALFGQFCYTLSCNDINEVVYMLNHINNAIDIIPLIDSDGVKLGLFYRGNDDKYSFVRQIYLNKKVGE